MLIRALIVLLLVLNLGVALWWAVRTPPPDTPAFTTDPRVPTLQLAEVPAAGVAPTEPAAPAPEPAQLEQCLAAGPFADAATAAQAAARLQPRVLQLQHRREFTGTPDGWRVFLPPFENIDQAEAAAGRIAAAGFSDYYVMRDGAQARSLALGLYGNEAAATQRADSLREAGFPAQVEPTGAGPVRHWLDIGATARFDAAAAQALIGAPQVQPLDCGALPPRS